VAVISVRTFGGIMPGVAERALPSDAATQAEGLVARVSEFRPVLDSTSYASVLSVTNPKTIWRFRYTAAGALNSSFSSGWKAYSAQTYLVRWPASDSNTERTSTANGSAAPRVIDNTGTDRQLGVPQPAKPTVTLNQGSYFTEQSRADAIATLKAGVLSTLQTYLTRKKVGHAYTNNATPGYLEDGAETVASINRFRVHRYDGYEGAITDAYTSAAEADVAWLRVQRSGDWYQTAGGDPGWMGAAGTWHYRVTYPAYGLGLEFNQGSAQTALDALNYVDTTQATAIASAVASLFSTSSVAAVAVIKPLQDAVTKFQQVIDARPPGSYSSAATTTKRNAALEAVANQIYDALARNASTYAVDIGGDA